MAITQLTRDDSFGVNLVRMVTSDALATVEASGYLAAQLANTTALNSGVWEWLESDMVVCYASDGHQIFTLNAALDDLVVYSTAGNGAVSLPVVANDFVVFDGTLGALKDLGFSASDATKTKVVMANAAVIANHIATYTDTAGTISDDASTAINGGNIQAGLSGTAGFLASFPSAAAKGSLRLTGVANTGDDIVTISNAAHGQASVYSIPDGGQATAEFIISDSAGTQHITSGSFQVDVGNISAGSDANAGTVIVFPATTGNGTVILSALDAGGAFNTTIRNAAMGQSTVYTIPDAANATARFVVGATGTPFVSGNFPVASGTGGLMVDSGVAAADLLVDTLASGEIFVGSAGGVATGVAMTGDASIVAAGTITLGAVVAADKVETYAPEAVIAGVPVLHVFNMVGGATATRTIATAQKITVVDAWVVNNGAGTANDTIEVKNAGGTAITDAIDISGADETIARAGEIDNAARVVAAGANLQCTETDGAGNDSPACDVYVLCYVTP